MNEALEKPLAGKKITVAATGGIALYKVCSLVRGLVRAGAEVRVAMTENATRFVGAVTFEALSGHPVALTEWTPGPDGAMPHIELAKCDLMIVAPATANILAKAAHGIADDLVSTLIEARRADIVFLPAMNVHMWTNAATQRNVAQLKAAGAHFIGPDAGFQACGDLGSGRMTEPEAALDALLGFFAPKVLKGRRVLVTAGPTFEAIDPVRGITNRSSGRQGYAIARAARDAGAEVELIAGPTSLADPFGIRTTHVVSADDMLRAVFERLEALQSPEAADRPAVDLFIGVAAVCDWRPKSASSVKIKRVKPAADNERCAPTPFASIAWTENADILAEVARSGRSAVTGGFAAETADDEALFAYAAAKLERKGIDFIVANDARSALDAPGNAVAWIARGQEAPLRFGPAAKSVCARFIVERAAERLDEKTRRQPA